MLRDLADRLRSVPEVDAVPALVTRSVGQALGARGVALLVTVDGRQERLALWGEIDSEHLTLPLHHGGEQVGALVLVPHPDGVTLDLGLLDPLTPALGATVAATALQQRLASAHRNVREARDGERARLRADLHDELSPSLSGVRLTLHAAMARLPGGNGSPVPDAGGDSRGDSGTAMVKDLLQRADSELGRASVVVRGILQDLRPDALTDGLVAAIRARAADFDRPGAFHVAVEADGTVPLLSPADPGPSQRPAAGIDSGSRP